WEEHGAGSDDAIVVRARPRPPPIPKSTPHQRQPAERPSTARPCAAPFRAPADGPTWTRSGAMSGVRGRPGSRRGATITSGRGAFQALHVVFLPSSPE